MPAVELVVVVVGVVEFYFVDEELFVIVLLVDGVVAGPAKIN